MNEAHFAEIERVLLYVSEARRSAEKTMRALREAGADAHLLEAAEEAERELERIGRTLMQQTYFAVPSDQLTLS